MLTSASVSSLENSISWAGTSKTSKLNVTKTAAMNVLMMSNINTCVEIKSRTPHAIDAMLSP